MISETDAMEVARQNAERAGQRAEWELVLKNALPGHEAVWAAEPFCLIREELLAPDAGTREACGRCRALRQRIKSYEPEAWKVKRARCLHLSYGKGEWMITDAMLEARRTLLMWAGRADLCHDALHCLAAVLDARLSQCWDRYVARGGLQEIHLKLLAEARWEVSLGRGDWCHLHVNGKHPFGDSYVALSVLKLMGQDLPRKAVEGVPPEDWELDEVAMRPLEERALEVMDELGFAAEDAARLALEAVNMARALLWYGEQARLARLIHSGGDVGRQALAEDGGRNAREVLDRLYGTEGRDG